MPDIITEFMKKTSLPLDEPSGESQGLPQPPLAWEPGEDAELIDLAEPPAVQLAPVDLPKLIEKRRTLRRYAPDPVTLAELSYLVWAAQGGRLVTPRPGTPRAGASARVHPAF